MTLVSTVELPPPAGVVVEHVETAAEMQAAVERLADDRRRRRDGRRRRRLPSRRLPPTASCKKHDGVPEIVLEPTPDILAGLGARKRPGQVLVGFAAETDRPGGATPTRSCVAKRLDLVVANDVSAPGVGFGHDTNAVTIVACRG